MVDHEQGPVLYPVKGPGGSCSIHFGGTLVAPPESSCGAVLTVLVLCAFKGRVSCRSFTDLRDMVPEKSDVDGRYGYELSLGVPAPQMPYMAISHVYVKCFQNATETGILRGC